MQTETESPAPLTAPASSNSPLGPSRSTALPDPAEAQRVIAQATARTRQARAALPPADSQRLVDRPLAERIAAVCEDAKTRPADPDVDRRAQEEAQRLHAEQVAKCQAALVLPRKYRDANLLAVAPEIAALHGPGGFSYGGVATTLFGRFDRPGIIALVGTRGPGKTWLGCALARLFARNGRIALYADALDYILALRSTYDNGAKVGHEQVERRFIVPALVVLDEFQERAETAFEDRMLTRLVNKRYAENLTTVLIANDSPEHFMQQVGPSIADRIYDGGELLVCDWPSLRGVR